jgi:hypothetical protein
MIIVNIKFLLLNFIIDQFTVILNIIKLNISNVKFGMLCVCKMRHNVRGNFIYLKRFIFFYNNLHQ